jgi:hypothetical protein
MMTPEQIKAIDKTTHPAKFLPTTIEFMKEMRIIANDGRERRGEPIIPWSSKDEARY